jgi:flagellar motility protein MotE (MotC chaperone)
VRSIRLLPVVIFAALALLVFKGLGLVTNGGYVLTGPVAVVAEEGASADTGLVTPSEAVMTDASPTMGDTAPTLATKVDAPPAGAPSDEPGASSSAAADPHASSSAAASSSSSEAANTPVCPETGPATPPAPPGTQHDLNDKIGTALGSGCASVEVPVNEHGDTLPTTKDGRGKIVPLVTAEGGDSEDALIGRLGERRAELDKRQADLDMRESLVAAAEKKLDDRTKALGDLEAQVKALVDEKQAAEDAGFKAIVSMYENMKPKDAAKIFDTLDLGVLLKVSRAMNPRKMSPILAAMSPQPAEQLTTAFATTDASNTVDVAQGQDMAALPQIVGH